EAVQELTRQRVFLLSCNVNIAVVCVREIESKVENILWIESQVRVREDEKAAHQQTSADQQDDRQRHFADDEAGTHPAMPKMSFDIFAVASQSRLQVSTHNVENGSETAEDCGQKRQTHNREKYWCVHADYNFFWQGAGWNQRDNDLQGEVSQDTTGHGSK